MLHKKLIALLIIAIALLFSACTVPYVQHAKVKGVYHRVKSGETLWQIAKAYNINLQELAEVNNIVDLNLIQADSVMFIPDANQVIDDVMSSAKLDGASAGTLKVEKTARQPYQAETMKEASIKPPVVTLKKDAEPIKDERIKTTASTIKEEDITKETQAAKTLPVMKDSKPEQRVVQPDKGQVRPETAAVKDKPKAAVPLKEKDTGIKTPPAVMDAPPPKAPEKKDMESKAVVSKTEPPVKQALEGTISSGLQFDKKRFIWPLQGKVISRFGIQPNGMYVNGIKIAAKEGTQVVAAAAGTVIFSASLKGYGETIIIKHEDNFATVYTHLYDRMVSVEDRVKKGDKIALLGRFEKEEDAYLILEIRQNNKARNPLFFLP